MKKIFYSGLLGLLLFEAANVYFIMPLPGSQRTASIGLAYFLYTWRWVFRVAFGAMILAGAGAAFRRSKVLTVLSLLAVIVVVYAANFKMAADSMFVQPKTVATFTASENKVDTSRLVIGVWLNNEAKAYPVQYLGYHHQVLDTVGGRPVMVTYCTVCRTGRVFAPVVNGKPESFRLVGMDHFNAMFEDAATKSWWRQATGEAVAGKLKGQRLPEIFSRQMSLRRWLMLHPQSKVMQPDTAFKKEYEAMKNYESGKSKSGLTKRDSLSWRDKSWVLGVIIDGESKAYDWNALQKEGIVYDAINNRPVAVVLLPDGQSFAAFERASAAQKFSLTNDTLFDGQNRYAFTGQSFTPGVPDLKSLNAYQEYWHSWQSFHPATKRN